MVVVENAIDMEVWYFSLPCMMLASAAGCVWMRRRERATRQRSDDRNAAQHATGTGVGTGVVDEAAMATISSPSREARVQHGVGSGISPNRRVHVPPPSPYCVPRASPVMDKIGVEILDLDTITLEDEKKLRENFSGESLFQMKVGWLDHQIRKLHTGDAAAIRLEVDRNDVFFDSFRALSKYTGEQLRGPLQVKFKRNCTHAHVHTCTNAHMHTFLCMHESFAWMYLRVHVWRNIWFWHLHLAAACPSRIMHNLSQTRCLVISYVHLLVV